MKTLKLSQNLDSVLASHFIIPSLLYMSQYTLRLVLSRTLRLLSVQTYKCWKQVGFMGYITAFSHQDQTEEMQTSQGIIMKSWTLSCVSHKEQVWCLQLIQSCPACAAGPAPPLEQQHFPFSVPLVLYKRQLTFWTTLQHHNGTVWFCKHGFINPFVSL